MEAWSPDDFAVIFGFNLFNQLWDQIGIALFPGLAPETRPLVVGAALMAAARFMPGVLAVFGSRLSPGITRTPLCFQPSSGMPGGRSWWSCPSCGMKLSSRPSSWNIEMCPE